MALSGNSTGATMSEINVTPMVDVMLVLLVIFMITAPMLQQGIDVELPKEGGKSLPVGQTLIVTLTTKEQVFLNKQRMSLAKLEGELRRMPAPQKRQEIYLRADEGVAYGAVMKIIAAIKRAGFERLGMVTEPRVQ